MSPEIAALIERTITKRRAAGLEVEITYPDRAEPWTAFASSDAQADRWVAGAVAKGMKARRLPATVQ